MIAPALVVTTAVAFAVAAGLLPALLSTFALLLPRASLSYRVVLWLGIFGLCGFTLPWAYVLLVERGTPAALGIRAQGWKLSLLLSVHGLPDAIGRDLHWPALGWALALGVPSGISALARARVRSS